MKLINIDKVSQIIKQVVSITPGVIAFAYRESKDSGNAIALLQDITPAIEIKKIKTNIYEIKIHIIASIFTSIIQVLQEVQNRVKYELENQLDFENEFKIDICIVDLKSEE